MQVYSVSEFVHGINELLTGIPACVQGEVSNFKITQNRFVWFELKDEKSYVSCFLLAFQLDVPLEDGMEIQVIGHPGLFAKSGRFHLRVNKIQVVGAGSLKKQYELLKAKLTKEGLFDTERKRTVPVFPQRIGLVTSKDAAAYTDVQRILKNRWAGLTITHFPVMVQGNHAANSIVQAIQYLNTHYAKKLDVVIVTRGGGSMEDLQAFNEEAVVRAVFALKVPSIAAIGHERDITLAELAADVRASTPSNAAELCVPDKQDVIQQLQMLVARQQRALETAQRLAVERTGHQVSALSQHVRHSAQAIALTRERFMAATVQWQAGITGWQQQLTKALALLHSYNPKATLRRGYSITTTSAGQVVTQPNQAPADSTIMTILADGTVDSRVL
jgi:exodeoxyribonuclease VII large subunit